MSGQPNRGTEGVMATAAQELAVHEKKELVSKEEKTVPGRYYIPYTDIHETDEALTVVMEMPGVEKKDINVSLENDVLRVDGQIDFGKKYEGMEPVYTEYNVGPYTRSFTLSNRIDQEKISAQLEDGVLTLTLPKAKEALLRRISIG
jgi:HSP20 family protein